MTPNLIFWLAVFVVICTFGSVYAKRFAIPFVEKSYYQERFASIFVMGILGSTIIIGTILIFWGCVYFTGIADRYAIWSPSKIIQKVTPVKHALFIDSGIITKTVARL